MTNNFIDDAKKIDFDAMELAVINRYATIGERAILSLTDFISLGAASGMTREEMAFVLKNDLATGGQLFGDFKKQFKSTTKFAIEQTVRGEVQEEFQDYKGLWEWVDISDKDECPDCRERGGQTDTYAGWVARGLPGMGATVCKQNCRCEIVPEKAVQDKKIVLKL